MIYTSIPADLERVNTRLDMYYKAEIAVLQGQAYQLEGRQLTRANIKWIQDKIDELKKEKTMLEAQLKGRSKRRTFHVTIRDW